MKQAAHPHVSKQVEHASPFVARHLCPPAVSALKWSTCAMTLYAFAISSTPAENITSPSHDENANTGAASSMSDPPHFGHDGVRDFVMNFRPHSRHSTATPAGFVIARTSIHIVALVVV